MAAVQRLKVAENPAKKKMKNRFLIFIIASMFARELVLYVCMLSYSCCLTKEFFLRSCDAY